MNLDTIAAINRKDGIVEVSGYDMAEALERIVAAGGRVEAMERGKHNADWFLEVWWNPNANI